MRLHAPFLKQAVDQRKDAGSTSSATPCRRPRSKNVEEPGCLGRDEHIPIRPRHGVIYDFDARERVGPDIHVADRSCQRARNPRLIRRYQVCLERGMIKDLPRPLVLWLAVWFFASLGCGPTNTAVSPDGGEGARGRKAARTMALRRARGRKWKYREGGEYVVVTAPALAAAGSGASISSCLNPHGEGVGRCQRQLLDQAGRALCRGGDNRRPRRGRAWR